MCRLLLYFAYLCNESIDSCLIPHFLLVFHFFIILALLLIKKVDALVFQKYVPFSYFHQMLLMRK